CGRSPVVKHSFRHWPKFAISASASSLTENIWQQCCGGRVTNAAHHAPRVAAAGDPDRAGAARPVARADHLPGAGDTMTAAADLFGHRPPPRKLRLTAPVPLERDIHEQCAK